jgi:hypothetical protein
MAAAPIAGSGDDPSPDGLSLSLDGKGNDVYPPGVYGAFDAASDDTVTSAFPVDDVTASVGRGSRSGKPSF